MPTASFFQTLRQINWVLTALVVAQILIGVIFIYSASYVDEETPVRSFWFKQLLWMCVGLGVYGILAVHDYRDYVRMAPWLYGIALALLMLVLIPGIGVTVYGARRWLSILGNRFQPSEIAKLATMLMLVNYLCRSSRKPDRPFSIGLAGVLVLVPMLLILKEPDLGTTMTFVPIALAVVFVAGFPMRLLAWLGGAGAVAVLVVMGLLFLPARIGLSEQTQAKCVRLTGLSSYQIDRIEVFFNSDKDPLGAGWNKTQSELAVSSGGIWGKGFRNGTQNILGFLPKSVAPTDFIFSVVAEEKGFFGSILVLLLFAGILALVLQCALQARDRIGRLLCVGVAATMFSHVFVNIGMTVGFLPITGLPLPLVSYGGSSLLITLAGLGMVQSVYLRSRPASDLE